MRSSRVQPLTLGRIKGIQQQVAVAEQRALGQAGRPGRVLQVDRIARRELPFGFLQPLRGNALAGRFEVLPGEHPRMLPAADADDPLQVRKLRAVEFAGPRGVQFRTDLPQQVEIGDRAEPLDQGQPADFRLRQRVFQLRRPVRRIDGHQDHADPGRGELQQHPLRPVRGPDAEVVAAAETRCASRPRAMRSTSRSNSAQVRRTPAWGKTIASRSGNRRAVCRSAAPMVRPSTHGWRCRTRGRRKKRASRRRQKSLKAARERFRVPMPIPRPARGGALPRSPTGSPAAAGRAARDAPAASMPPARASAARAPLASPRRVEHGSALAARTVSSSSRAATNCSTPSFHRSGGQTASSSPIANPCCAEIFRPVRSIGKAASNPTNSGKRWVPPQAGNRPNLTSGRPSRVESSSRAIR